MDSRFNTLEVDLNNKVINNLRNGDKVRAKVLANELAQIRKIKCTTQKLLMSLEVIVIRFSTVSEFAEILDTINPMIETINEIKDDINRTVPVASSIISEMSTLTSDVLMQANVNVDIHHISIPVNSDALEILNEAQNIMEEETKSKLPEIPISINHNTKYLSKKNELVAKNSEVLLEA
jgi:division protein CdvB (Snf7/Vps24/ESCRT-III family)